MKALILILGMVSSSFHGSLATNAFAAEDTCYSTSKSLPQFLECMSLIEDVLLLNCKSQGKVKKLYLDFYNSASWLEPRVVMTSPLRRRAEEVLFSQGAVEGDSVSVIRNNRGTGLISYGKASLISVQESSLTIEWVPTSGLNHRYWNKKINLQCKLSYF